MRDVPGVRGVVVTNVSPGSPGAAAGLKIDDRIIAINNRMVSDTKSLVQQLSVAAPTDEILMRLVRNDQLIDASVDLGPNASAKVAPPPNTLSSESPTLAPTPEPSGPTPNGSLLGGLGAALGGVFGSQEPSTAAAEVAKAETAKAEELPTPARLLPVKKPVLPAPKDDLLAPMAEDTTFIAPPTLPPAEADSELKTEIKRLREQLDRLEAKLEKE